MGSDGLTEPECNGICLSAADIGVPYDGIAYAHPDCPAHGDPQEEDPSADICGDGAEDLRYVREEDMGSDGMTPKVQYTDEVAHFAETGKLFDKPEDFELAEPSYRIKLVSCHDSALIERTLDAAEMAFMRSLAGQINGLENGGHVDGCVPTMLVCQRIKPGDLDEDENFRPVIEP